MQFNARATPETVEAYAIADRQGWLVGETLEHAPAGALGLAVLSIESLVFLAHPQGVVGEVHSDLVAVGFDLLRRIEPPVVRDHVR
jgi:hypothetical protein